MKGWTTVPVFAYQDTEPVDPDVPSTVEEYAPPQMPPLFEVAERLGVERCRKMGTKQECLHYITEVWTEMRPLSLREKMEEGARGSE